MKLVVALGGKALPRRGQALSVDNQFDNVRVAAVQLAQVSGAHEFRRVRGTEGESA